MKSSTPIELPYTRASFMRLLRHGAAPEGSPFTHKQIAEWCDRFWCQYLDSDAPADIEPLLPLLTEVETQWDLYLANTYSVKELQTSDFENAVLPTAWFEEWLTRAQVAP